MGVYKLILAVEQAGCVMVPEREYIRVMNIDSLSKSLIEEIKRNKLKILESLNRDKQAKRAGFMVGVQGQLYFCSVNKACAVYIEQISSNWEVWRETYINDRHRAINVKVIFVNPSFEYVLFKGESYLGYLERKSK